MKNKIEWTGQRLPLANLKTHPSVQREFDMAHARSIAQSWQSLVARPLIVVQMTSGDHGFYVVDGQHTRWAAERVGEKFLDCRVIRAKTKAEMNEIFHLVNSGVKHISPIDSYGMNSRNDRTTADALSNQILEACNLSVGRRTKSPHRIAAVQPVRKSFASLGADGFAIAASIWELLADSGHSITSEVVNAITQVLLERGTHEDFVGDIAGLLDAEFGQIKADAAKRCINTSLSESPHILTEEILDRYDLGYRGIGRVA